MEDLQVQYIKYIQSFFSFIPTNYLKYLDFLDSIWFYGLFLIFVKFYSRDKEKWQDLVILSLTSVFSNIFLKDLFSLPRPPKDVALIELSSSSFPSGAAQGAIIFYLMFFKNLQYRYQVIGLFLGGFMCLARVILGVHYFSDLLGGLFVGFALYFMYDNIPSKRSWLLVIITLLLALSGKAWTIWRTFYSL